MIAPTCRALVVDDDDFSRATAVRILRRLGVTEIVQAGDGRTALTLAARMGNAIDLILCDLRMPQVDGIETIAGLVARSRSALFVLVSSAEPRLLRAAASTAKRAGIAALEVMSKPVTLAKMQAVVALMSEGRHQPPEPASTQPAMHSFTVEEVVRGLAQKEFTTFYQPKVDIGSGHPCGAEALVRWHHPRFGLVPASAFMGIAQAHGLLNDIFFVALPTAVGDCARWVRQGYRGGVSINLPTAVIGARDLPNQLEAFVAEQGLDPHRVTFEVTEDGWLHEQDLAREVLTRLRLRGFGLAIDDFGTGYSGVQQLLNAPFNELKIDQGFIRAAPVDTEAAIAVASFVALARQLDLSVVAEGVETEAQWDAVSDVGCDQAQGYWVAHPLAADAFENWLAGRRQSRAPSAAAR